MNQAPFLEAKNIGKSFYGVPALQNISVECYPGEVLGVIGENGAGKSTLMKIISGAYSLQDGEIYVDGELCRINNPSDAQKLGISMVYQDTRLVADLTVLQNVCLNNEHTTRFGVVDYSGQKARILEMFQKFGISVDINARVKNLTIAQKQLVEIVKALLYDSRMLILDEPTSSLTPKEVDRLFDIVREITADGASVVFISHRIPELINICDRFVVLKDGIYVGQTSVHDADETKLVRMMVGRDITRDHFSGEPREYTEDDVLLKVENLSLSPHFSNVNFKLYHGEILGFYGIEGNGQREMLRSIMGLMPAEKGAIQIRGRHIAPKTPRQAMDSGLSFLTNDRHGMNVFMPLSIKENMTALNLSRWNRGGVLISKVVSQEVEGAKERFAVKCMDTGQLIRELSGGNQQKVAMASRYLNKPEVLILDEPTIGVDVGSKDEIYTFLRELADSGIGVVILSSDITEIMRVSDRILTMANGRISKEFTGGEATEESLLDASINLVREKKEEKTETFINNPMRTGLFTNKWSHIIILMTLIAFMGVFANSRSTNFMSPYNIGLMLMQFVPLAFVSLGHSSVILLGMIDLSVGSVMSMTTCLMSYVLMPGANIPLGILICLLAGFLCGVMNGLIVVKLKVPHYIATVGTQTIILGIALILRPSAGGKISKEFTELVGLKIGKDFPAFILIVLILFILLEFTLQKTKTGVHFYAVGSNSESAYSSGIRTDRFRMAAYIFSALTATLAGMVLAIRIGCGDPQAGTNFTTNSLTAVVLGGVSLSGGHGTFAGPMVGGFLIIVLQSFLNMIQVPAYYQYVYSGLLIVLAVSFYHYVEIKSRKLKGGK